MALIQVNEEFDTRQKANAFSEDYYGNWPAWAYGTSLLITARLSMNLNLVYTVTGHRFED